MMDLHNICLVSAKEFIQLGMFLSHRGLQTEENGRGSRVMAIKTT